MPNKTNNDSTYILRVLGQRLAVILKCRDTKDNLEMKIVSFYDDFSINRLQAAEDVSRAKSPY